MWENIGVVLMMIAWLAFVVGGLVLWIKVIRPHRDKTFAKVKIENKIRNQRARDQAAAEVMAKYERKGKL